MHVAVTKQLRRLEVRGLGGALLHRAAGLRAHGVLCRLAAASFSSASQHTAQLQSLPWHARPCVQAEEQLLQEILRRAEQEEAEQQEQPEGSGQPPAAQPSQRQERQGRQQPAQPAQQQQAQQQQHSEEGED